jgi:hypothetical protein
VELTLRHGEKRIDIAPAVRWYGAMHTQARLHLGFSDTFERFYYATPCAVAEQGVAMSELHTFAPDEVSDEIYARYREVLGWYAAEGGGGGVSVSADIGCFDFNGAATDAILFKNVFSCGDLDYVPSNEGRLKWTLSFTSYKGSWEENGSWKAGMELRRPLAVTKPSRAVSAVSPPCSLLNGADTGVLITLKRMYENKDALAARIINPTSASGGLSLRGPGGWKAEGSLDLMEKPVDDADGIIGPWEIKTINLSEQPS